MKTKSIFKVLFVSIVILCSLVVTGPNVLAAIYYVSPYSGSPLGIDGRDTRNATQAQTRTTPWATLQHAADNVVAGDTVILLAGTYTIGGSENYFLEFYGSGTNGAPITFKSENPAIYDIGGNNHAILDGQNLNFAGIVCFGNFITIDGFEVKNMSSATHSDLGFGITISDEGPPNYPYYTNGIITRNYVHHIACNLSESTDGNSGIGGGGSYFTIDSNIVTDVGRTGAVSPGNFVSPTNGDLSFNDHNFYVNLNNSTFSNNICYNTDTGPFRGMVIHIYDATGVGDFIHDLKVVNNTVIGPGVNSGSQPIIIAGATPRSSRNFNNIDVSNNILWNTNSDSGIRFSWITNLTNVRVYNNLTNLNAADSVTTDGVVGTIQINEQNNITSYAGALFVDENNYDFHLNAASSAINGAYLSVLPDYDLDHVTRPQSPNGDIGAYEYTESSPPPAPPKPEFKLKMGNGHKLVIGGRGSRVE